MGCSVCAICLENNFIHVQPSLGAFFWKSDIKTQKMKLVLMYKHWLDPVIFWESLLCSLRSYVPRAHNGNMTKCPMFPHSTCVLSKGPMFPNSKWHIMETWQWCCPALCICLIWHELLVGGFMCVNRILNWGTKDPRKIDMPPYFAGTEISW